MSSSPEPRTRAVWLLPFSLLVIAVVAVPVRILDEAGLPRYRRLETQLHEVRAQNERLGRDVHALRREVEGLRHDPEAVERVARDELGMIREGELVFQFSE